MERLELPWTEMGIAVGLTSIFPGMMGRLGIHLEYIMSGVHIKISDWKYWAYSWVYQPEPMGSYVIKIKLGNHQHIDDIWSHIQNVNILENICTLNNFCMLRYIVPWLWIWCIVACFFPPSKIVCLIINIGMMVFQ